MKSKLENKLKSEPRGDVRMKIASRCEGETKARTKGKSERITQGTTREDEIRRINWDGASGRFIGRTGRQIGR